MRNDGQNHRLGRWAPVLASNAVPGSRQEELDAASRTRGRRVRAVVHSDLSPGVFAAEPESKADTDGRGKGGNGSLCTPYKTHQDKTRLLKSHVYISQQALTHCGGEFTVPRAWVWRVWGPRPAPRGARGSRPGQRARQLVSQPRGRGLHAGLSLEAMRSGKVEGGLGPVLGAPRPLPTGCRQYPQPWRGQNVSRLC